MNRRSAGRLLTTLILGLAAAPPLVSQTKKDKNSGLDRIEGTIQSLNREKRSMIVRQRDRRNITWTILWDEETALTYQNEDTTEDDLRVGARVIALGRFPEGSLKLSALRIEIRTGR
jgi:hypothetical protein